MKSPLLLAAIVAAWVAWAALSSIDIPDANGFKDPYPGQEEEQEKDRTWQLTQSTHYSYPGFWDPEDLEEYSYDQFNRPLQYTVKTWNDGAWLLVNVKDHFYNPEGLLSETIWRNFDGYEWQKSQKVCYEYDGAGRKTLMAVYTFYNNAWVEWYRHLYTYTPAGLLATDNTYHVDGQGVYIETNLKIYTYNAAGQLTELFERNITGDWEWVFEHRTLYSYDQDGLLTQTLFQELDGNCIWQDLARHLYYYDANGLQTEDCCQSYYSTSGWQNWYRYLFSYGANGLLSENHYQEYDGEWVSDHRYLYTRDIHGNDIEHLYQHWVDGVWNDSEKWVRVFAYTQSEDELVTGLQPDLTCHPNPFAGSVEISFELKTPARAELAVYNLRGQRLCDLSMATYGPGKHSLTWDGLDGEGKPLPAGIYLLRLRAAGQGTSLKKISKR